MSPGCEHEDVRYSKGERGAVACFVCGRLFGHLVGETFRAFNPVVEPFGVRAVTPQGPRA